MSERPFPLRAATRSPVTRDCEPMPTNAPTNADPADATEAAIPLVAGIADIAAGTDAWLVDIWGVMHNGVAPFAGAVEACRRFRAQGGTVVLVSNAPRPAASVAQQLDRIGVSRDSWDAIVSSGDAARGLIGDLGDTPVLHIGPERDLPLFEGLAVRRVDEADARAVVCSGLYDDETETPDDYRGLLGRLLDRRLPMICANPDIIVERGHKMIYCAGAVAELYRELGGEVTFYGKPHRPAYQRAFELATARRGMKVPRERILAIGDSVRTDLAGANNFGIGCVFVTRGIHSADFASLDEIDAATSRQLFGETKPPFVLMRDLRW